MEIRDEDQRLSKEEYDAYTYPDSNASDIFLKIDLAAIPNYAPQMDDGVYIIIDGNIVATSSVTTDTETSVSIPILGPSEMYLNSYALSAEELQLEERFVADMEIVIGKLSEDTIDEGYLSYGSSYSFDSVFARTAPDAPVSLALEGPGTLDGQIGDGAPSDDPLQTATDYALTGPLVVSVMRQVALRFLMFQQMLHLISL